VFEAEARIGNIPNQKTFILPRAICILGGGNNPKYMKACVSLVGEVLLMVQKSGKPVDVDDNRWKPQCFTGVSTSFM